MELASKEKSVNSKDPEKLRLLMNRNEKYYVECDIPIEWRKIRIGLKKTPNNKAPDTDQISSEIWKIVQDEEAPGSNFAKIEI
ncbi:hypothetical protein AYI68_g5605 [Smittium mucronatum]|uniref:Uncharacterized protein n=1 Tax=Smittium mucronatum TaxID=133383 RepID=A0A1R0GTT3_9FUNG|nr:hypothetical protein AYI68_g5605 [Smittium mucronatum]